MLRSLSCAAVLALALTACGDDDDAGDGGAGSDATAADASVLPDAPPGTPDAAPPDAFVDPPDAGPCNTLTNAASDVTITISTAAPPSSPAGGTIVDGTYYLTGRVLYNAGTDTTQGTMRATMTINGNALEMITRTSGNDLASSATYTTSGTDITATQSCPSMNALGWDSYTASGSTLIIFDKPSANPPIWLLTYQRQ